MNTNTKASWQRAMTGGLLAALLVTVPAAPSGGASRAESPQVAALAPDARGRVADRGFFWTYRRRMAAARLAGGTFHCEDGLRAHVPWPVQRACAEAVVQAAVVSAPSNPRSP